MHLSSYSDITVLSMGQIDLQYILSISILPITPFLISLYGSFAILRTESHNFRYANGADSRSLPSIPHGQKLWAFADHSTGEYSHWVVNLACLGN